MFIYNTSKMCYVIELKFYYCIDRAKLYQVDYVVIYLDKDLWSLSY
jgi:hypothetical protein